MTTQIRNITRKELLPAFNCLLIGILGGLLLFITVPRCVHFHSLFYYRTTYDNIYSHLGRGI